MKCEHCGHENPEGAQSCEECGVSLSVAEQPQPEPEAERTGTKFDPAHSEAMLHEAFRLSDEGKLDEAITAAEEAVAANPGSTSAHSVLGTLLHRKGEVNRAIAEYETVLALSPESGADRARLEQVLGIRRGRARIGWPLGVALAALVILALAAVWSVVNRASQPTLARPTALAPHTPTAPPSAMTTTPALPAPLGPPAAAPATTTPSTPAASETTPTLPLIPPTGRSVANPTTTPQPTRVTTTPRVVAPVVPIVPATAPPATPEESERQASAYYWQRNYTEAAKAFEKAIAGQANPSPRLYQDAAWCYVKLGRGSDALASYQAAIEGYRRQIAEGRNRESAEHGLRTCQAALRTLATGTP